MRRIDHCSVDDDDGNWIAIGDLLAGALAKLKAGQKLSPAERFAIEAPRLKRVETDAEAA